MMISTLLRASATSSSESSRRSTAFQKKWLKSKLMSYRKSSNRRSLRRIVMKHVKRSSSLIICLVFVVALISCAGSRTRETTGEYVDDSVITTKVKTALLVDPDVKSLDIGVETFKGVVQLSGFVNNAEQARKAVEIARSVQGVKSVKNSLVVK